MKLKIAVIGLCLAALPACAVRLTGGLRADSAPPPAAFSGGAPSQMPYELNGVWYYPIESAQGYLQEGIASWYGKKFHGRLTSNGETYDMYAMTAAHKTLPLGTHVKVTHRENGKSVVVRVNDRGPFVAGRIIDLSFRAAQTLGMDRQGTALVQVEAIQRASEHHRDGATRWETEPVPDFRHGTFTIQAGAFQTRDYAMQFMRQLSSDHTHLRMVSPDAGQAGGYYRIFLGQFSDLIEAHLVAAQLTEQGCRGAFVVADESQEQREP